jgi:hypothetical protein
MHGAWKAAIDTGTGGAGRLRRSQAAIHSHLKLQIVQVSFDVRCFESIQRLDGSS